MAKTDSYHRNGTNFEAVNLPCKLKFSLDPLSYLLPNSLMHELIL